MRLQHFSVISCCCAAFLVFFLSFLSSSSPRPLGRGCKQLGVRQHWKTRRIAHLDRHTPYRPGFGSQKQGPGPDLHRRRGGTSPGLTLRTVNKAPARSGCFFCLSPAPAHTYADGGSAAAECNVATNLSVGSNGGHGTEGDGLLPALVANGG